MARKQRVSYPGVAEHVIQRGNNRKTIFTSDLDRQRYAGWLSQYARKYGVAIHAWVFMDNHVHLLCTPSSELSISKMMQSLGRMYVPYFNKQYKRSGTLWEGRYRSCLVESEIYFMQVSRYIELNPVRANLVDDPAGFCWSSYGCNALGKYAELQSEHDLYLRLGNSPLERQRAYRSLFDAKVSSASNEEIRQATNKGLAFASIAFKQNIEAITGCRVVEKSRGRSK